MATEKRLIDKDALIEQCDAPHWCVWMSEIEDFPTVDAVEVVRCEKCVHCVNDEEEHGMCKCVESAEYDSESGLWLGFVEYHTPDFFCAYGERKDNGTID